ncbi:uncharacterized protein [Hetaerina americana]|uniref:uncharacterized protein n=1 Tax=Hetaerina americana TaxID=62018 RepID=UPI003A7F1B79
MTVFPRTLNSVHLLIWYCYILQELNLSHNEISVVPEFFRDLQKLRKVDFSHNRIKLLSFDNLFFVNGITLEELDKLDELPGRYLQKNGYLELPNSHHLTVDLRYNEISEFDLPMDKVEMVRGSEGMHRFFARATLLLGRNPIACGCQTFKLLRYWQQEIRPVAEEETWGGQRLMLPAAIDIQGLSCSEPPSLRQMNLTDPETWTQHLLPLAGLCLLQGYDLGPT